MLWISASEKAAGRAEKSVLVCLVRGCWWFSSSHHNPSGESASNCHARQKNNRKEHEYPGECAAKGAKSIGHPHGAILGLLGVGVR